MTRIKSFIKTKLFFLIIGSLSLISIFTFLSANTLSSYEPDLAYNQQAIPTPSVTQTFPTPVPAEETIVEETSTTQPTLIPKQKPTKFSIPTPAPTPTQSPVLPTLTLTPVLETVAVTLHQPNGTRNFTVAWQKEMSACDVIKQAKLEGDIDTLVLEESYVTSFKSPYVYEINGYKDNWVFEVNGKSPLGCALVTIEKDDVIVWKYL